MGLFRDFAERGIDFVREEVLPLRGELVKAGIITPDQSAYDQKASLTDPWAYAQTAYGYKERWSVIDYSKLRQISYSDPIIAAVMQTRINQIASFSQPQADKYKLGFKIVLADKEARPTDGNKARIKEIEEFMCNCGVPESFDDTPLVKRRDSFETFLRKIVRDSLTFDQINFEVTPRRDGSPYSFTAVDAATIRLLPDAKDWAEALNEGQGKSHQNQPAHYYWDGNVNKETGFDEFQPKHPKYVQVINGRIAHTFDEWELAFGIRNPRTDIVAMGYGYSELEMMITTITSHLNAEAYNRKFFSQGSVIKGIMTFEGTVPPDQLENFRRQWWQQVSGIQNSWRTPIMSLGKDAKLNWVDLHQTNREMEYGKWMEYCIKTICGIFQIDPIEIGFDISRQGAGQQASTGGLGQGNQQERILYSQEKGLKPLLVHIESLINDYIITRLDPEYRFEFVGLGSKTEKDDLDQSIQEVKNYKTVNEIRAEHDLEPIPEMDKIKSLGDIPLDSSWIQLFGQKVQAEQQQEMMEQGGGVGPDGQPLPGQGGEAGQEAQAPGQEEEQKPVDQMSDEEIEAELKQLSGQGGEEKEAKPEKAKKSLTLEL